jgi:hypothetical protein
MESNRRTSLASGLLLMLIGVVFLILQLVPALKDLIHYDFTWPIIVVLVGFGLFIFGLMVHSPGMAVPACIVAGIGGLLYYQNATGDWGSWAYAWTLIPGFSGVGTILAGLLGMDTRHSLEAGAWQVFVSLVLFFIFSSFLGGLTLFGSYWPLLLVVLGLMILVRPLFRPRKK